MNVYVPSDSDFLNMDEAYPFDRDCLPVSSRIIIHPHKDNNFRDIWTSEQINNGTHKVQQVCGGERVWAYDQIIKQNQKNQFLSMILIYLLYLLHKWTEILKWIP